MSTAKGQMNLASIMPIVVIPVALVIALLVYSIADDTLRQQGILKVTTVNETLGTVDAVPKTLFTSFAFVDIESSTEKVFLTNSTSGISSLLVRNGSASCNGGASCYTITKVVSGANQDHAQVQIWATETGSAMQATITYDHFSGTSAGDTLSTVSSNTYSGYDLGSILPIVIVGVIILSVVISAFAFRRQ